LRKKGTKQKQGQKRTREMKGDKKKTKKGEKAIKH
jgi:hypothetical protein